MAQTWRVGTFQSGLFAESVWAGLDNGVAVDTSVGTNRMNEGNGWMWFWGIVLAFTIHRP